MAVQASIDKQYVRELEVIEAKEEAEQAIKRVEQAERLKAEAQQEKT